MLKCSRPHGLLSKEIAEAVNVQGDAGPRDYFRMSETTKCPRRLAFARFGVAKSDDFTAQVRSKLQLGDILHNYIRGSLIPDNTPFEVQDWNPKKELEQEVVFEELVSLGRGKKVKVKLVGHFDGTLAVKGGNRTSVLEVKTTGANGFRAVTKEQFNRREHYSWSYVKQALRYCAAYNKGKLKKDQLQDITIFVYNTDGTSANGTIANYQDFWFKFDPLLFREDLMGLAQAELHIQNAKGEVTLVPRCADSPTDPECNICSWKTECWKKG